MRAFVRGKPVDHAPTSIRLFQLCANMNWAHLPVEGGIYDQHPQLLEEWEVIFHEQADFQKEENERRAWEAKNKKK